ncbi:hypothetical protein GPAL_1819 [Glaciecola pallidula DSM 14239 = ACAM 615]|jgi:hypothetical protein|uniref:Uncharacterized protein n=1 Tax=Brumicola pallidula DSM 14239 = ACAM 615 TaxID=1121922 RepID=K6YXH1_9ALTE|nr:hypothetical protein GPAL_1819 [Glaciecola pallidula DSM 14239 = ACAM 615]
MTFTAFLEALYLEALYLGALKLEYKSLHGLYVLLNFNMEFNIKLSEEKT